MMRIILTLTLILLSTLTLAACNTVQGVGKDLESAGRGLQDL